jgi:nicotinate-nucleotide pyrophosphorylase (carboxylating)
MGSSAFILLRYNPMTNLDPGFHSFLKRAFQEDLSHRGDVTSLGIFGQHATAKAYWQAKEAGIFSGADYLLPIFTYLEDSTQVALYTKNGAPFAAGDVLLEVEGPAYALLSAERIALNLIQRCCGIATQTHRLSQRIAHTPARLLDTRKTTPLLRRFEKEAVVHGGGLNHRFGLFDMAMIKDNHRDFAGGILPAYQRLMAYLHQNELDLPIEIETRNLQDVQEVLGLPGKVQRVMFDNFSPSQVKLAVHLVNGQIETEASGGITETNLLDYAETGVDFISMGALTHSVRSIDISMKAYLA